jgi:YD repeat-containing protein
MHGPEDSLDVLWQALGVLSWATGIPWHALDFIWQVPRALWEFLGSLTLEQWSDLATVIAGAGTVLAALVAIRAVQQARHLQDEKSQPYVVALVENNPNVAEILELSFKNVGDTAARDIHISFDPKPQRSAWGSSETEVKDIKLPESIPVLVPGQEWRTTWDSSHSRSEADLPDRHTVTLTYKGLKDSEHAEVYVLDWKHLYLRGYMEERTIHHLAKDMREIKQLMTNRGIRTRVNGPLDVRIEAPSPAETD